MNALFTRWLPSFSLAVWSAVLLGTFLTGRVNAFLHPSFRPGVAIAGSALAALALFIASRETPPDCCADASCTHPLARSKGGRWMTFFILVIPASIAAWLSPENFSKQAFEQRGIVTDVESLGSRRLPPAEDVAALRANTPPSEAGPASSQKTSASAPTVATSPDASATPSPSPSTATTTNDQNKSAPTPTLEGNENLPDYLQKTPDGYVIVEVLDLLYAVQDSQLRKDFEGRSVQLIAQMMPSKVADGPQNRFKAVRMFMTCCAADARPVATMVEATPLPEIPEMTWVRIIGKATFPLENGKRTAVIQATSVSETKPPEETMLF